MFIPAIVATPSGGVLVASPSSSLREQVRHNFYDHRWPVQEVMGGADALLKLETGNWQLLYLDRRLFDLTSGQEKSRPFGAGHPGCLPGTGSVFCFEHRGTAGNEGPYAFQRRAGGRNLPASCRYWPDCHAV